MIHLRKSVLSLLVPAAAISVLSTSGALKPAHAVFKQDGAQPPPKPRTPFFHYGWKEEISELALRAAVGDTTGDGKPRLVLLVQKPQQLGLATLIVKKWNGTEFVKEFSGDVDATPNRLAVGKFAGIDKPAIIVTADAMWSWNGTTYIRTAARQQLNIFGSAKMSNKDERLILSEDGKQVSFKSYKISPAAGADWLSDRAEVPDASSVEWENMRAEPEFFKKMGMPAVFGSGGLITLWDTARAKQPYLYYCRPAAETDVATGQPKTNSYLAFRDATDPAGNELWTTTKLNGMATDMALEDPRSTGKRGLFILSSSATTGKSRTLYFFGLD